MLREYYSRMVEDNVTIHSRTARVEWHEKLHKTQQFSYERLDSFCSELTEDEVETLLIKAKKKLYRRLKLRVFLLQEPVKILLVERDSLKGKLILLRNKKQRILVTYRKLRHFRDRKLKLINNELNIVLQKLEGINTELKILCEDQNTCLTKLEIK